MPHEPARRDADPAEVTRLLETISASDPSSIPAIGAPDQDAFGQLSERLLAQSRSYSETDLHRQLADALARVRASTLSPGRRATVGAWLLRLLLGPLATRRVQPDDPDALRDLISDVRALSAQLAARLADAERLDTEAREVGRGLAAALAALETFAQQNPDTPAASEARARHADLQQTCRSLEELQATLARQADADRPLNRTLSQLITALAEYEGQDWLPGDPGAVQARADLARQLAAALARHR